MSSHMLNITVHYRDIIQACELNDLDAVKNFQAKRVPITTCNEDNESLAHIAAKRCYLPLLKYLLETEPELQNARDIFGNTILHSVALYCGSLDLLKYLILERGMDIYEPASPHLGNGAIHMAAHAGWIHMLKYFFEEKQVDVNLRNRMGQPIAFAAALNRKIFVIRYLLEERNANFFITDHNNDNILLIAAKIGDLSVPYYLLEEKKMNFDLDWKDRFGGTVLHQAARHNHLVLVKYFVGEKKLNFNEQDEIGRTPLHEAAEQNHIQIVKYLMERGASVFMRDEFGKTPLQVATDKLVIQYLKQYMPPERKRRSLPESFLIPSIGNNTIREEIAAKSTQVTPSSLPFWQHVNSFLLLTSVWVKNISKSSYYSSLLTPPESIRSRIDSNAIDAVHAFTIFAER